MSELRFELLSVEGKLPKHKPRWIEPPERTRPARSKVFVDERAHLQLPAGLFVPLHERQFGAKAPEVHVVHHVRPLRGYFIHRLGEEDMVFCAKTKGTWENRES